MEPAGTKAAVPSTSRHTILPNDPRLMRCGFAKLQGDGIEFFVRKYEVTIGRTSKNSTLDLVLGDSTTISRQHATIRYNFDTKCFELVVLGKNGVSVESCGSGASHLYTPDSPPTPLRSRDLLIMGEKRLYFLMPRAMGAQSRKRRRLEPSPAPGPTMPLPAHAAAPSAAAPASAPQPAPAVPPQPARGAQQTTPQTPASPSEGSAATGMSPARCPPVHSAANLAAHHPGAQQHPPQPAAQPQQQPDYAHVPTLDGAGGAPAALGAPQPQPYAMQHDDDDALINANSMPYDNGVPYGYDAEDNDFPGGF